MSDHVWLIYILTPRGRWRALRNSSVFTSKKNAEAMIESEERNRNFTRPVRIEVPIFLKGSE